MKIGKDMDLDALRDVVQNTDATKAEIAEIRDRLVYRFDGYDTNSISAGVWCDLTTINRKKEVVALRSFLVVTQLSGRQNFITAEYKSEKLNFAEALKEIKKQNAYMICETDHVEIINILEEK